MWDVSRKVVPHKRSLDRERPVTKALKFPSCTRKTVFHLNWKGVCEKECIQTDTMTGMVECIQTDTMTGMVECVQTDRHDDRYGGVYTDGQTR